MKKVISVLLTLSMMLTLLPVSVVLAEGACGTCGENLTWWLDDADTLTISGEGEMDDYYTPWEDFDFSKVVIEGGVTSIGAYAFNGNANLSNVIIANSVVCVGDGAFSSCESLNDIIIPASVTSIGEYAFFGCSSLKNITVAENNATYASEEGVLFNKDKTKLIYCPEGKMGAYTIPDSVTSIGEEAFYGCGSLTGITISNSVTSIGAYAFCECVSLEDIVISNNVTSIGTDAFYSTGYYYNANNWENNVLYIGNCLVKAKNNIQGMYNVRPETKIIGDFAFLRCAGLKSIAIPNSVVNIGENAFYECSKDIIIYGVIGSAAEEYAVENGILFSDEEIVYTISFDANGGTGVPDTQTKTHGTDINLSLIAPIREGYKFLGWATSSSAIYATCRPGGLFTTNADTTLYAVWRAQSEEAVTLTYTADKTTVTAGDIVTVSIEVDRLSTCGWDLLEFEVAYNEGQLIPLRQDDGSEFIWGPAAEDAFRISVNLETNPILGAAIAADHLLANGTVLSIQFQVADSVQPGDVIALSGNTVQFIHSIIENGAQAGDIDLVEPGITTVKLDVGSKQGNENGENNNTQDGNDDIAGGNTGEEDDQSPSGEIYEGFCGADAEYAFSVDTGLLQITGTGEVWEFAFSSVDFASDIKAIEISQGITNLPKEAVDCCSNLANIYVNEENDVYSSENGVLFNKDKTVLLCCPVGKAGAYVIPDGVTDIRYGAFLNCADLTSVIIPYGVTDIGDKAFAGCVRLQKITYPTGIESGGRYIFEGCSNITIYGKPGSVAEQTATDEGFAFRSIPMYKDEATGIAVDAYTFEEFDANISLLTNLTKISDTKTVVEITFDKEDQMVFPKNNVTVSVPVPEGMLGDSCEVYYLADDGSKVYVDATYVNKRNLVFNASDYGKYVIEGEFSTTRGVTADGWEFEVENGTASIKDYVGDDTDIVVPAKINGYDVTIIEEGSFWASNITSIVIPESVTEIEMYSFAHSYKLNSVTILGADMVIGPAAFANCALTSVNMPNGVKSIGMTAFASCSNLEAVVLGVGTRDIEESAFFNCANLKEISIPNSVTNIGMYAFGYCPDGGERVAMSGFAVIGYSGTAAETYAQENGFNFIALGQSTVVGDVDGTAGVTAADALLALQAATGKVELDESATKAADVDGQNGVTANDALMILQYATKKIAAFPIAG